MLGTPPPPLAEQVAALAADLRLEAARQGEESGIIAALQALILISLARIFTSLERMVALWQAGLLPPPAPRRPRVATQHPRSVAPTPRRPRARRHSRATAPRSPAPLAPEPVRRPAPRPPITAAAPVPAPFPPAARPRAPARAPPWRHLSRRLQTPPPLHAHFVTI